MSLVNRRGLFVGLNKKCPHSDFDYFLKTIADRELTWPSRRFLFFPFFANTGQFLLDIVIHQDCLHQDLIWMNDEFIELNYTQMDRQKVSVNRKSRDYREYYNTELVDLVKDTWGRELDLYGYSFEGMKAGLISKMVNPILKERIRYSWEKDKLMIDNTEVC